MTEKPHEIASPERVHIVTETVALTIRVGDHPPIKIDVSRLQREPYWLILPVNPQCQEIVRTDTDDHADPSFAAFDIKIASTTVAG